MGGGGGGGGGLRAGRGCGGEGGIALVLVSYLCRVGGAKAANWGRSVGFVARAGSAVLGVSVCPWQELRASPKV